MFLLNSGHDLSFSTEIENLNGMVALASGNYSYRLSGLHDFQKLFFDPQLYLSTLDEKICGVTCANLSTYPWFQTPNIPELALTEKKPDFQKRVKDAALANWQRRVPTRIYDACLSAINFQIQIKCSHIILPSPLITTREDEGATQAQWLDEALEAVEEIDPVQSIIATVALDECVLADDAFSDAGFLDTIVDQISSRTKINGVYIVISQTHKNSLYTTPTRVNKAYLRLVQKFSSAGVEQIIVNFADVFGVVTIAFGATLVANGPGVSTRQLSLKGYEASGGGLALPHYFSRKSISEYRSNSDLKLLVDRNLWRRIEDVTIFSAPLVDAIRTKSDFTQVTVWTESQNNIAAAKKHFVKSFAELLADIKIQNDKKSYIRTWLEDAEMIQSHVMTKVGKSGFPPRHAPIEGWLELWDIASV